MHCGYGDLTVKRRPLRAVHSSDTGRGCGIRELDRDLAHDLLNVRKLGVSGIYGVTCKDLACIIVAVEEEAGVTVYVNAIHTVSTRGVIEIALSKLCLEHFLCRAEIIREILVIDIRLYLIERHRALTYRGRGSVSRLRLDGRDKTANGGKEHNESQSSR